MVSTDRHAHRPRWNRARRYDLLSRVLGPGDAQWQLVAQAAIAPTATVLEIGCGTGNVALLAKRAAPAATVIGLDPDDEALAAAAQKGSRAGLELQLDHGSAGRLPYADASVDRVLSSFMFHHLQGDERLAALQEVRRVLVPGGSLHLLDLTSGAPVPWGRLLHLGRAHGPGHGHGHGHDGPSGTLLALMAQAGLAEPTEVATGTSPLGGHTFYRAGR